MKSLFFQAVILCSLFFTACNNGENAGAGSTENPTLKPNQEGVSEDTSGTTSGNMKVEPANGSAYTNGEQTGSLIDSVSGKNVELKNQAQPGPGSKMNTDRKADNTSNASGGSGANSSPTP